MGTLFFYFQGKFTMGSDKFQVTYRKVMRNPLLSRRQMIIDVSHPEKETPTVSKSSLQQRVLSDFKLKEKNQVSVFGMRTAFGGGRSTGFCLIYDNAEAAKKFEPKYRLRRLKLLPERTGSAKQKKE